MMPLAHIGGWPLEEALGQLAPVALAVAVTLRLARERLRCRAQRLRAGAVSRRCPR
jgi:hypothetical protein